MTIGDKDSIAVPASKRSKKEKSTKSDKAASEKNGKGKSKKVKAEKDPNAPKKPLTAFMLYTNIRRPDIMKKNVGLKITEVSSLIGNEWKKLTEEEKNVRASLINFRSGETRPRRKSSCTT